MTDQERARAYLREWSHGGRVALSARAQEAELLALLGAVRQNERARIVAEVRKQAAGPRGTWTRLVWLDVAAEIERGGDQ